VKTAAKRMAKKKPATFEQQYREALLDYSENPREAALGRAYEFGRKTIAEGKSLMEISSIHHQALRHMVSEAKNSRPQQKLLIAGADFLAETLSPYEMAHRGFQDAVKALRRLNETLEEEIKRIAHAVHDEAGQLLVAVHIALAELAGTLPKLHHPQLARMDELLCQVETQLRRFSHELRPTILDDLGWLAALRFLADSVSRRTGIPVRVRTTINGRLRDSQETALYRIVQEAITNAVKHVHPRHVVVDIRVRRNVLCCSILDDGGGFDPRTIHSHRKRRGLGLVGIQERLNALGGILSLDSAPGRGTKVVVRFPVEVSDAHSYRPR
jgi:signal transduction histidine kinase